MPLHVLPFMPLHAFNPSLTRENSNQQAASNIGVMRGAPDNLSINQSNATTEYAQ